MGRIRPEKTCSRRRNSPASSGIWPDGSRRGAAHSQLCLQPPQCTPNASGIQVRRKSDSRPRAPSGQADRGSERGSCGSQATETEAGGTGPETDELAAE